MSIFLSCGEASGDFLISSLALSIKKVGYTGRLWGMVGPLSEGAGVKPVWFSSNLHIMGITQAMAAVFRLNRLAEDICDRILRLNPDSVVVADSPDFHIPLVRRLRKKGYRGKAVFLSPPTVWAWRGGRVVSLRELFDLCLPLFGFEDRYLRSKCVPSAWIGHPMVDSFGPPSPPPGNRLVALLPGSRGSEVEKLLPILLSLADRLRCRGLIPVFSVAPGLNERAKSAMLSELCGHETFYGEARDLLSRSDFAIGASGTVAVEAMMCGRFMAIMYRGGPLEWFVYKNLVDLRFVSMPNVITGRPIYPEFLQDRCTPDVIWPDILSFLRSKKRREKVYSWLKLGRSMMGEQGASDFWAKAVLGS